MGERDHSGSKFFSHAAENGIFWMAIFLGTIGFLSLFSAGRQAIQAGSGKVRALAEGRSHRTSEGLLPICSVDNGQRQAALTFEIERGTAGVEEILTILESNQVKASFFINEAWAQAYPDQVRKIAGGGHDLGCMRRPGASAESQSAQRERHSVQEERHSVQEERNSDSGERYSAQGELDSKLEKSHSNLEKQTSSSSHFQQELMEVRQCIRQITGREIQLFRPQPGAFDDDLIMTACGMGYYPVLWDVDSEDWRDYGAVQMTEQVLKDPALKDGSIIRFHCGARYTPEALTEIIRGLKEQGYELTPLSGLVLPEQYRLDERGRQTAK